MAALECEAAHNSSMTVMHARDWQELRAIALKVPLQLLVVDGDLFSAGVERLSLFIRSFPELPIAVYREVNAPHSPRLITLVAMSIQKLMRLGVDDISRQPLGLYAPDSLNSFERVMWSALSGIVPPRLHNVVHWIICNSHRAISVQEVARVYCRHPKTIRDHMRQAGLPPTDKLIQWVRLFRSVYLCAGGSRSFDAVAMDLDYPSGSALRSQLYRYTGIRPRILRGKRGMELLSLAFRQRITSGEWKVVGPSTVGGGCNPLDPRSLDVS